VLEADVRDAFLRAVRAVIRLRPDLVLLTGDLFDGSEPPPEAATTLLRGVRSIGKALPRTPVLVLAGPRDTPITPGDAGPLAMLEPFPRVEVATGTVRSVHLREAGVHVLLVPHSALRDPPFPPLNPDPEARWNVLALHAFEGGREGTVQVDPSRWDWVALGGDHRGRDVSPRVATAGSLARVSPDPWRESGEERGFITVDLATGVVTRHPLPGRPVVEVAPLRRGRQDLPRVNARIRGAVEAVPGGVDGKRVRLRVHGLSPEERTELDGAFLSVVRRRAAQLQLQLRSDDGRGAFEDLSPHADRRGLRILVGGTERQREEVLSTWRRDGAGGVPEPPGPDDRPETDDELVLWRGRGPDQPGAFLAAAAGILERIRGAPPDPRSGVGAPPEGAPRPGDAESMSTGIELEEAQATVLALRADSVEVDGEVEALTVEWLRERQDAETQLQTYRDRARELRERIRSMESAGEDAPCPVCGRPLSDHLGKVVEDFQDEWDALVQDGRWWRRRREQLEPKPEALRTLEAAGIRLHAELEAASERLEALRAGLPPRGRDAAHRGRRGRAVGTEPSAVPAADAPGREPGRGASLDLLARGSDLLNRLTDGEMAGIVERDGAIRLVADGVVMPLEAEGERAAVRCALHLALVELALEAGVAPTLLRVGGPVTRLAPGHAGRAVLLLARLARHLPGVVLNGPPGVAERMPEWFSGIVELRAGQDASGRPRLIPRPAGPARIRLLTRDPGG
jgi:DNA repair protein SbcD/Mre11